MSVTFIIAHANKEVLNTDQFVEEVKKKWPEVGIHFISDPKVHSIFQFKISGDFSVLGDFRGTGISYKSHSQTETAQFALWYRSIVPSDWQLQYYDSGLYFDIMELTNETTEEQIISGFDIPFDGDKYE
jgi:hypothetical protein